MNRKQQIVLVRGAGDLATGVIQKLWRSGFLVVALETAAPTTIRRQVALSSAVKAGSCTVEDLTARRADSVDQLPTLWAEGRIPILVDPLGKSIAALSPLAVVDAILAKKNLGTHRGMAPITIGLGPGFSAPEDVTAVIETMRGHHLGRLITEGSALPNTGVPGLVGGQSHQRVIHSPIAGTVRHNKNLGDHVQIGDLLFWVDEFPVTAPIEGILRGLIEEDLAIPQGMKCADIDPRLEVQQHYNTISDKARCLGGAVLEAILYYNRLTPQPKEPIL